MRLSLASIVLCSLPLLLSLPTSHSAVVKKKRNNCTGNPDPDCLPNYNDFKRNATFDDLTPKTKLTTYKGLTYTGFTVIKAPGPSSQSAHVVPSSSPNYIRALLSTAVDSSPPNITITSKGDIFKFKALSFACSAFHALQPVPCTLNISGFDPPGAHGQQPEYRNSVILNYTAGASGADAGMRTVTGDDTGGPLGHLDLANYYTFQTTGPAASRPRLYLDDVDAVYYKFF